MGVVAGVFMTSGGAEWPAADTSNPLYALDREHYMRVVRGKYDLIKEGGGRVGEMNMEKATDHEHTEATAHSRN